jgi:glutaredoxin
LKHKNIQNELKYQNLISSLNQSNNGNDPTKTWIAQFADGLQKVLTSSSPLNEGKKSLVRALAGEYDDEAVRAKLNGLISENQVLMLSFTTWPFCIKAKDVLNKYGGPGSYKVVELDVVSDGKPLRAEMANIIGRTSVPAIWIGGKFIGGCNDGPLGGVVKLDESGELSPMLEAAR